MPYIGQRPATGEANSFKILDDISNYTLTFGSSDIDVSADTITAREHRFVTGQRVTYGNGGGTDPTGLSNGTVYYIIVEDRHTFKLATSASNAVAGTAINITAAGAGAAHTINVAFDGVNTKFKATHTNGTKADITQSGQLMVSVNGVLQQPHDNTTTPSTGYATDHTSTIIFSAAPASTDQFFGRLIASNFATFDISDNTVDNFTGDGNTSTFTLSKTPPNNESVLVTIDGVVQYPDDNAAVRAYTVSENVIDFASAPGNAVEIQVRHIGFAGASTAAVSGFYGRTGNAALKSTDDIVFNNATAGIVTATNITVTGDLTVNGTTTTLDTELTSVDKLEVAANNTTVAAAITQTGSGDILNLYDGSTEVFTVTDGGNVGINSSIPASTLDVYKDFNGIGAGNYAGRVYGTDSGVSETGVRFVTKGTGDLHNVSDAYLMHGISNGTTRFVFGANGNVGIGTEIPNSTIDIISPQFDISGNINASTANQNSGITVQANAGHAPGAAGAGIRFAQRWFDGSTHNIVTAGIFGYKRNGNGNYGGGLKIATSNGTAGSLATRITIDDSGNVGIGTDNPDNHLHLLSTGGTVAKFESTNATSSLIRFANASGENVYIGFKDTNEFFIRTGASERLRIDSDGKVGIGTDNPDATLKVNVASGNNGVVVQNTSTASIALIGARNGDATLQVGQFGSTASGTTFGLSNADLSFIYTTTYNTTHPSALALGTVSNKPIVFATNNTERVRIDSNGELELRKNQDGVTGRPDNRIIFKDTDTSVAANQPIGEISWYSTDAGMVNVNSYIRGINEATNGSGALTFGVKASGSSEIEALRITSKLVELVLQLMIHKQD